MNTNKEKKHFLKLLKKEKVEGRVILGVESVLELIGEESDSDFRLPIVVIASFECVSKEIIERVIDFLGIRVSGNPEFITEELFACGSTDVEVLTHHCNQLRFEGYRKFYYTHSLDVIRKYPNGFFRIVDARAVDVLYGKSGVGEEL